MFTGLGSYEDVQRRNERKRHQAALLAEQIAEKQRLREQQQKEEQERAKREREREDRQRREFERSENTGRGRDPYYSQDHHGMPQKTEAAVMHEKVREMWTAAKAETPRSNADFAHAVRGRKSSKQIDIDAEWADWEQRHPNRAMNRARRDSKMTTPKQASGGGSGDTHEAERSSSGPVGTVNVVAVRIPGAASAGGTPRLGVSSSPTHAGSAGATVAASSYSNNSSRPALAPQPPPPPIRPVVPAPSAASEAWPSPWSAGGRLQAAGLQAAQQPRLAEDLRSIASSAMQDELQRLKRSCLGQREGLRTEAERLRVEASRLLVEQAYVPSVPQRLSRVAAQGGLAPPPLQMPLGGGAGRSAIPHPSRSSHGLAPLPLPLPVAQQQQILSPPLQRHEGLMPSPKPLSPQLLRIAGEDVSKVSNVPRRELDGMLASPSAARGLSGQPQPLSVPALPGPAYAEAHAAVAAAAAVASRWSSPPSAAPRPIISTRSQGSVPAHIGSPAVAAAGAGVVWNNATSSKNRCGGCGNIYVHDAIFCRKCGRKRPEAFELSERRVLVNTLPEESTLVFPGATSTESQLPPGKLAPDAKGLAETGVGIAMEASGNGKSQAVPPLDLAKAAEQPQHQPQQHSKRKATKGSSSAASEFSADLGSLQYTQTEASFSVTSLPATHGLPSHHGGASSVAPLASGTAAVANSTATSAPGADNAASTTPSTAGAAAAALAAVVVSRPADDPGATEITKASLDRTSPRGFASSGLEEDRAPEDRAPFDRVVDLGAALRSASLTSGLLEGNLSGEAGAGAGDGDGSTRQGEVASQKSPRRTQDFLMSALIGESGGGGTGAVGGNGSSSQPPPLPRTPRS